MKMQKILVITLLLCPATLSSPVSNDVIDFPDTLNQYVADELEFVPDINGRFYSINTTQYRLEYLKTKKTDYKILYYVVTRQYPGEGKSFIVGNASSLRESGFNPEYPTRILVHGWTGNRDSIVNVLIGKAYLQRREYNIIVVDWTDAADTYDYYSARRSIGPVGKKVAEMIDFLNVSGNTPPDKIYMIGHSLGAHMVSATARRVQSGQIGVIIGLDAALPLFSERYKDRLSASDAKYVLSIHTNGGIFGIYEPIGHGSFYPNWGRGQPGCGLDFGNCAHGRCVSYFAESILESKNGFLSHKCRSFRDILNRKCFTKAAYLAYLGGDPINTNYKGVFYLKTNSKQPFGMNLTNF